MFCSVPGNGVYFSGSGPPGAWLNTPPTRSSPVPPKRMAVLSRWPTGLHGASKEEGLRLGQAPLTTCFTLLWKWELEGETGRHSRGPGPVSADVSTLL